MATILGARVRYGLVLGRRHMSLMRDRNFVNGQWVTALSNHTFEIKNPANDRVLGRVQDSASTDVQIAIDAASEAFASWSVEPAKMRSDLLRKLFQLLQSNSEEVAKIMTAESGKPLVESRAEVAYAAAYLEWFSEEARRIYGEVLTAPNPQREAVVLKEPIGVCGFITPWNFPLAMLARKLAPALAAGCTCVARPAEDTPYTALALAALVEEARFPPGSFNVVTSSRVHAASIGQTLCTSPKVAGISFTGSTAVGKQLYRQCADTVKRLGLELGGNASLIVFPSADLSRALQGVMTSKFRNAGQTCIATNRVYVHESIADTFAAVLTDAVQKQLVMGDGFDKEVNQGPLINDQQLHKVQGLIDDAVGKGARLMTGGCIHPTLGGRFFSPTVISGVNSSMNIYHEEIFGPVIPLHTFSNEEEVLELANSTRRGLASYFYSQDYAQVWRVAKRLQVGIIGVNEGLVSSAEVPFGGIKESGIGREGSRHGIDDYVNIKYVCFGGLQN